MEGSIVESEQEMDPELDPLCIQNISRPLIQVTLTFNCPQTISLPSEIWDVDHFDWKKGSIL